MAQLLNPVTNSHDRRHAPLNPAVFVLQKACGWLAPARASVRCGFSGSLETMAEAIPFAAATTEYCLMNSRCAPLGGHGCRLTRASINPSMEPLKTVTPGASLKSAEHPAKRDTITLRPANSASFATN